MNAFLRNLALTFGLCASSACAYGTITLTAGGVRILKDLDSPQPSGGVLSVFTTGGYVQRTLVKFDLSSLPSGGAVGNATLRLSANTGVPDGKPMEVYRITTAWDINAVTWNTAQNTPNGKQPWAMPGGDFQGTGVGDATPYATTSGNWNLGWHYPTTPQLVTWNITSLVQEWYSGANPNYGLLLLSYDGNELHFENTAFVDIDMVAVPEPSTVVAGALLLLPFGAQAVRRLRNRKQ